MSRAKETDAVITVESVSKSFLLPHKNANSIKSLITGFHKSGARTDKQSNEVQHALKDIDFSVGRGEFFGIVGRNGSGKSTLLKILAGIYQPTEGRVTTVGKLVPFIELGVGFNPELTGRENVYLNGAMLGFSEKEIQAMYKDIVEFAELERFMDQKLKNYSSGMQVRLAFSMATRADADVLLVDEVLAVGDADFQRKCFEYFKNLKKNKKTVVFVSHDMSAVKEYCDKAILIDNSQLIMAGSAAKVAAEYTKLFTEKPATQHGNLTPAKRWGDEGLIQTSVSLSAKKVTDEVKELVLEVAFTAKQNAQNPVFGFIVKNGAGTQLFGTNSRLKGVEPRSYKAGETGRISWTIANIFNDGLHTIDLAISHEDGVTQYDWWEDATTFEVFRTEKTPYIVAPNITINIPREK